MKQKLFTFLFLFLLGIGTTYCQFENNMRHHVIVAVDMTMPHQSWQQSDSTFLIAFNKILTDSILRQDDLLSIVGFSTDEHAANFDDYTYVIQNYQLGDLEHLSFTTSLKNDLRKQWYNIASQGNRHHHGERPFSMISLAKMYAFAPVKQKDTSHYVNRTFLLFISDHKYNGGDFYEEAVSLNYFNHRLTPSMMQDYGQRVASQYFVRHISGQEHRNHQHIDLFEYIPLQDGLTLPTIIDFPAGNIKAKRVKYGHYQLNITAATRHDPRYRLLQLRYRIVDNKGEVILDTICRAITNGNDYTELDSFKVVRDLGTHHRAVSVMIDAWVSFRDGIYNATVLTPVANAPTYLASNGLKVNVPIQYENKVLILGIMPLPGILQFSDNQESCAAVISLIASLLLLVVLIVLVRRIRIYHPKAEDITIELN